MNSKTKKGRRALFEVGHALIEDGEKVVLAIVTIPLKKAKLTKATNIDGTKYTEFSLFG